mgnify:CR=1 FL=1
MSHLPQWSHVLSVRNARLDEQHIILIELSKELLALLQQAPPLSQRSPPLRWVMAGIFML